MRALVLKPGPPYGLELINDSPVPQLGDGEVSNAFCKTEKRQTIPVLIACMWCRAAELGFPRCCTDHYSQMQASGLYNLACRY